MGEVGPGRCRWRCRASFWLGRRIDKINRITGNPRSAPVPRKRPLFAAFNDVGVFMPEPLMSLRDLVHDEQVGLAQSAASPAAGLASSSSFSSAGSNASGRVTPSMAGRLCRRRFRRCRVQTRWGPCCASRGLTGAAPHGRTAVSSRNAMVRRRPGVFAEADHEHFEQTALDGTVDSRCAA